MIFHHWTLDPFLAFGVILAVWHEVGVRRMTGRAPRRAA